MPTIYVIIKHLLFATLTNQINFREYYIIFSTFYLSLINGFDLREKWVQVYT